MPTISQPVADPALDTQAFWLRYKQPILLGLAALILILAGAVGYWLYSDRQEAAAAESLAKAKTAADYQKVIAEFPDRPAAGDAYLLLADQQRRAKNYAEANKTLGDFIARFPKHDLVTTAHMAMAANLESLGKNDEALAAYQRLAATYPHSFNAPLALLSEVHLLRQKNQIEEARRVCETVEAQYPDSLARQEARRQLRTLKPKVAAPIPAPASSQAAPPAPVAPAAGTATTPVPSGQTPAPAFPPAKP